MTARSDPVAKFNAELLAGRHDDSLGTILEALSHRILETNTLRWRLVIPQVTVSEEDMTLGEAFLLERILGTTWALIDPKASAEQCRAILQVAVHKRTDVSMEEAGKVVDGLTVGDIGRSLTMYQADVGPFLDAPGETPP